jgi:hypothetical protein
MSTVAWVVIAALAVVVLVLSVVVRSLVGRLTVTQAQVADLELTIASFGPLLADTRSALRKAESRNVRADDLVHVATSITTTADAASKFAYNVATNPIVRVLAWSRGLRRGAAALKAPSNVPPPQLPASRKRGELPSGATGKRLRRFK